MMPSPRARRIRLFSIVMLVAFALSQPAALCATLCPMNAHSLQAEHQAGHHPHHQSTTNGRGCHTGTVSPEQAGIAQLLLSPMTPAAVQPLPPAGDPLAQPGFAIRTSHPTVALAVEPPPPRIG